ncbi:MAG: hypothetical protein ABJX82_08645, partial [Paracoccaceae bacterium]
GFSPPNVTGSPENTNINLNRCGSVSRIYSSLRGVGPGRQPEYPPPDRHWTCVLICANQWRIEKFAIILLTKNHAAEKSS